MTPRYELHTEDPGEDALAAVEALHWRVFGDDQGPPLVHDLRHPGRSLLVLALDDQVPVGYKLGYERSPGSFYSHLGGVDPAYRRQGIAAELLRLQHQWCRKQGFSRVRTKTMNRWRGMLLLNLDHGFDVIGSERHRTGALKIILEKALEPLPGEPGESP